MRWTTAKSPFRAPQVDDRRSIRKFLFLPRRIGEETRWLEQAYIWQRYKLLRVTDD